MYVQLSAASLSYYAYLPIVVKAWKLCGFNSIVFLVYNKISKNMIYLRSVLRLLGSEVIYLKLNNTLSLHYASKLARIYGFEVNKKTKNCDYMILSDADMIPISKTYFSDMKNGKLTIKSFGPNGYGFGNNSGRWAMCYMIANKYIWKDILKYDINYNESIEIIVSKLIRYLLQKGVNYFGNYVYLDEVYMRDKIREWKYFNTNVIFHPRNYYNTRIDKSKWPNNYSFINKANIIDIHLPILPSDRKSLREFWIKRIIPLQKYIFNYIPFGKNYIDKISKVT